MKENVNYKAVGRDIRLKQQTPVAVKDEKGKRTVGRHEAGNIRR